jgi:hypothetical protein
MSALFCGQRRLQTPQRKPRTRSQISGSLQIAQQSQCPPAVSAPSTKLSTCVAIGRFKTLSFSMIAVYLHDDGILDVDEKVLYVPLLIISEIDSRSAGLTRDKLRVMVEAQRLR